MKETITRHVGECQICAQTQKLHDSRLVHHGFKRPGDGAIHGDCMGVYAPPYEISCELLKKYTQGLRESLDSSKRYLRELESGKIRQLSRSRVEGRGQNRKFVIDEFACGVTELYAWLDVVSRTISETNYQIRMLSAEIAHCIRRIAAWAPKPIRTIEEAAAEERAAKDERKAEREAKQAEKRRKAAELKAKRDARAAQRQAVMDGFIERFRDLATRPANEERKALAFAIAEEIKQKKNHKFGHWYSYELNIDETFVELGLAVREVYKHGKTDATWIRRLI